jgi:hypothetical protein
MVYDSIRGVCVLFGGATNYSFPLGDTWEWDGQAWALVANTGPVSRWSHGMAFDETRGVTVVFGGTHDNSVNLDDTWEWNGQAWTQRQVPGPGARRDCRMTFDSSRGLVVLFGGGFSRDTWEWNGQLWQLRLTLEPLPPPSGASVFVYDTRRRRSVLLGQYPGSGVSSSSWWERDGNEWSEQSTATGLWGEGNAMAYDIHRDVMVLLRSTASARVQTIEYSLSPGCPLDLNEDGLIDIDDLLLLIGAWGPCSDGDCPADLTHDGVVNIDDLLILLGGWD